MECTEAQRALKSSCYGEIAMKSSTPQTFSEDFLCFAAGINGVLPSDDFSVDEFFNLEEEEEEEEEEEGEEERDSSSVSLSSQDQVDDGLCNSTCFSGATISGSLSGDELHIPVDDMAELELWSHFMDDSISEVSVVYPVVNAHSKSGVSAEKEPELEPKPAGSGTPYIQASFPVKPRSKRPRGNHQGWSSWSPLKTECLTLSSAAAAAAAAAMGLVLTKPVQEAGSLYCGFAKPAWKKRKKKPATEDCGSQELLRRCTHCQVQKTPQWRTGPFGPKTLCNACGVRFKSGRLYPEYRPACSPTFSSEIHSNSHRKVLEIRRKKELAGLAPTITW